MSRFIRALVVSVVATATAVAISAVIQNREGLSALLSQEKPDRNEPDSSSATPEPTPHVDPLSNDEEQMLISELEQHV